MDFEAEFHEKFHTLPGSTVSEKKKNLNAFIRELDNRIPQKTTRNTFIINLKPKDKLETVFRVDLLLHYQIYDVILELLKSGNSLYISMILKDWNFFKETFQSMSASTFVDDVLSHTSFAARMKIINRVSKNLYSQEKANEYFKTIEEKYGIVSAETMLTFCSLDVVKDKIQKYNLKLKQRQLMAMLKRDSGFLEFYFGYLNESDLTRLKKENVVKGILKEDEQLFWESCSKYYVFINFGKHSTKRLLRGRPEMFNKIGYFRFTFHNRQVYKELRQDPDAFKQFILQNTTDDITDFCDNYLSSYGHVGGHIYRYISKDRRYRFLNDSFKAKFCSNLHDNPEIVNENVLRLMPQNIRENVLEVKIKEKEKLAYLYRAEISVPLIMDRIKHCSDRKKRISYVSMLYRTCELSRNDGYLLDILKYVETRHRNDANALQTIMERLSSWKNIEDLSVDHWTYIARIQKLLKQKNIVVSEKLFLEKRIVHLLNNNMDAAEEMQNYCEFLKRNRRIDHFFEETPEYRRLCVLEMEKYLDKVADVDESLSLSVRYLHWVHHYNISTSSKDCIPMLNYLPLIHKLLEKNHLSNIKDIIEFYVRLHYEEFNPIIWKYRRHFFEQVSHRKKNTLFSWYLLHHEDEVLNNIELIFELYSVRRNVKFVRYLSLCAFRNIPEKLSQLAVKTMHSKDECIDDKIDALTVLSLLDEEQFLHIFELFKPNDDGRVSCDDPPNKIMFQEALLKNLKLLNPSLDLLQILLKFCVGDYLKYALKALYSIISRVPCKEAAIFLQKLHKSAVSVRKHSIHLGKFIFSLYDYINFIINESVSEKNASLKNILFQKALEYGRIMPTPRIWEMIKATMDGVDKEDVEAHDMLLNIDQIPEAYRAVYISHVYTKFDSSSNLDIRKKRLDFIKNIPTGVIDQLDRNLLQTFIAEVIFNEYCRYRDCFLKFIFYSTGEKQNFLFDFTLRKLEEYNNLHLDDVIDDKQSSFANKLCEAILEFHLDYSMVKKFASIWFGKFRPEINVDLFFLVTFISIYAECKYDIKQFAAKSKELLETYRDCPELFTEYLNNFLGRLNHLDVCEFVESFMTDQESIPACLLSIRILSLGKPKTKEEALRYGSIIQTLKQRPELSIKIYFHKFLHDYEQQMKF